MTKLNRIRQIVAKARKYRRKVYEFSCKFNAVTEQYDYTIILSAGRARASYIYEFENLFPDARALIESLPSPRR
jgi:hypothetical protein